MGEVPEESLALFELFGSAGEELYLVGGFVRDRILGRENGDLDMATSAAPGRTREILESAGMKAIMLGAGFGTVGTLVDAGGERVSVQITTFRRGERYPPGSRRPDVVLGGSLEEDLVRRDFTVNAMAMDGSGRLYDPLGGMSDLEEGVLRTPTDPMTTLGEDPLRMLRAFRFCASLGFRPAPALLRAVEARRGEIDTVSRERCKAEMDGLLTAPEGRCVADALSLMADSGLLACLLPQLAPVLRERGSPQGPAHTGDVWEHTLEVISRLGTADRCARWAALLHDAGKPAVRTAGEDGQPHFHGHEGRGAKLAEDVARSLRFSKRERACVRLLVAAHMRPVLYSPEWTERAVRRLVRDAGEHLGRLMDLAEADLRAHSRDYAERGLRLLRELRERIAGLGYRRGERVLPGELGRLLRDGLPEGASPSLVGDCLSLLAELVHDGELPAMADPRVYMAYVEDRGGMLRFAGTEGDG